MASAVASTAGASLRASTSSVCRCSFRYGAAKSKESHRTFSTSGPSSLPGGQSWEAKNKAAPSKHTSHPSRRRRIDPEPTTRNVWHEQRRSFHASTSKLAPKNPYSVLGVDKSAPISDIKKKYYQLAKQYHPDTNKDETAKARFVEIQEAYDTLGDDKKRAAFDKYGAASQQPGFSEEAYARASAGFGGGGGFGGFADMFGGGAAGGPGGASASDIFEQMFGASFSGRPGSTRAGSSYGPGEDIQETIRVPFMDACKGTKRTIEISPIVECDTCAGSGMKVGAKKQTCRTCGGTGQRQIMIQNGFVMATTCNACGGSGSTTDPKDICGSCGGNGKVRTKKKVDIDIPAGVEDGMRIFMAGMGDAPLEGKGRAGDLQIRIEVVPSRTFRRQGSNIYHDKTIPFHSAILGGKVTIPTLEDDVSIKVPTGTQPGDDFVLRGKGVPKLNRGDRGDLHVRFNVTIPKSLSKRQKALLEEFVADSEGLPTRRWIDTADPEATAQLASWNSAKPSSAESPSAETNSPLASDTTAPGPSKEPSRSSIGADRPEKVVEEIQPEPEPRPEPQPEPHPVAEAEAEERPYSLWQSFKGNVRQWLRDGR